LNNFIEKNYTTSLSMRTDRAYDSREYSHYMNTCVTRYRPIDLPRGRPVYTSGRNPKLNGPPVSVTENLYHV